MTRLDTAIRGHDFAAERGIAKSMSLPFTHEQGRRIVEAFSTPVYVYDEAGIRASARRLNQAFSWMGNVGFTKNTVGNRGFGNFFAGKATPTPDILEILKDEGFGIDCSSLPELLLAQQVGFTGEQIMFTSNNTPAREYQLAVAMGATLNLDDITHIPFLEANLPGGRLPPVISFRYNPGPLREGNGLIGNPEEAKYGLTKEQIFEAYDIVKGKGVKRFGLHTMVASNELNPQYFVDTAKMIFGMVGELADRGIPIEFVNLGGGIGIPYRPEENPVDLNMVSAGVRAAYKDQIVARGLDPVGITMENGRVITGPHGYLLTTAQHFKDTYRQYVGVDASMADLMRPGMYGAYHHITVLGKEGAPRNVVVDVVGGLCENNDKFGIQRALPSIDRDDILVIHDAGAHGRAMGFNYNGKLRAGEVLLGADGRVGLIRRHETVADHFATLVFDKREIILN